MLVEHGDNLLIAEFGAHVAAFEEGVGEALFVFVHLEDALFDGLGGNEFVDGDGAGLPDAV